MDVEPSLIAAMIYAESRFSDQTSHAGARGLMQITPDTARKSSETAGGTNFELEDLSDPDINIRYGTFYLRELLDRSTGTRSRRWPPTTPGSATSTSGAGRG